MVGKPRRIVPLFAAIGVVAAAAGCSSDENGSPETGFTRQDGGDALSLPAVDSATDSRLDLGISWDGGAVLPADGVTTCRHVTYARGDEESWEYAVSTSDFTDYDGGGEYPGRDFAVEATLGVWTADDTRTDAVRVSFSGPGGGHHRLGGTSDDGLSVSVSDDRTVLTFAINALATSIDAAPRWTAAAGTVRCDQIDKVTR